MTTSLLMVIKEAIRPLANRFGLRVISEVDRPNYAEVRYANGTTGLSVAVDWSEFRPFLRLYELKDGKFPEHPISYSSSDRLQTFDVDDLLLLRAGSGAPVGKMLGERSTVAAARLLAEYASALESQASDVLSGEFASFAELDKIVKERAQGLRRAR